MVYPGQQATARCANLPRFKLRLLAAEPTHPHKDRLWDAAVAGKRDQVLVGHDAGAARPGGRSAVSASSCDRVPVVEPALRRVRGLLLWAAT